MIFHTQKPSTTYPAPREGTLQKTAYEFNLARGLLGLALFLIVVVAALIAQGMNWPDGAQAFMHMAEVVLGGLAGIIIAERIVISEINQ